LFPRKENRKKKYSKKALTRESLVGIKIGLSKVGIPDKSIKQGGYFGKRLF
jgi:hypothetical protein